MNNKDTKIDGLHFKAVPRPDCERVRLFGDMYFTIDLESTDIEQVLQNLQGVESNNDVIDAMIYGLNMLREIADKGEKK